MPTPAVVTVFPVGAVPENLLRVHVVVSTPVGDGQLPHRVHLFDGEGHEVAHAFFTPQHELWNLDRTKLTLLLDPARVKTRLAAHEGLGRALRAGEAMSLVVDAGWTDLRGAESPSAFRADFTVLPEDRAIEPLSAWEVTPPPAGTRDPLRVALPEPLDVVGLHAFSSVVDATGEPVRGVLTVERGGRSWMFVPNEVWRPGDFRVVVDPRLEDLAGNSFVQGLEYAVGQRRATVDVQHLRFVVGAGSRPAL